MAVVKLDILPTNNIFCALNLLLDPTCYGCGETGHIARDCPQKGENDSMQGGKKTFFESAFPNNFCPKHAEMICSLQIFNARIRFVFLLTGYTLTGSTGQRPLNDWIIFMRLFAEWLHNWICCLSNRSKQKLEKLTRLMAPAHNIRSEVWMKNDMHDYTDNCFSFKLSSLYCVPALSAEWVSLICFWLIAGATDPIIRHENLQV